MKKKSLTPILLLLIFSTLFTFTACKSVITLTDLDTPTGLTVTDGVLHWNSVNAANAYVVNCDGVDVGTVSDVRYTLTGLTAGTTYLYKVKAKHTLGAYNDSPYSEAYSYKHVVNNSSDDDPVQTDPSDLSPLLSPANITINDGKISWDSVDNAQSYIVSINGTEYTATKNELTVSSLKDGVYNIKVKAVGDGKTYSSSEYCKEMAVDLYDGSVCTNEQFGNFKDLNQFESFLGYGFDVVADSIVSDRTVLTSFPIFNVDELLKMRFLKVNSKSSQVKAISEDNIESFAEQWNRSLNVNITLSGNVSTSISAAAASASWSMGGSSSLKEKYSINNSTSRVASAHFYCITLTDQKFYIVMQGDMDTYRSMLSAGFEKDLYDPTVSPAVLCQRYGTHFITSAIMGGRMNAYYNMFSHASEIKQEQYWEISKTLTSSFNTMFSGTYQGVTGSVGTESSSSSSKEFNESLQKAFSNSKINAQESIDIMGGGDFGVATVAQIPEIYADWQKSLDAYPSLMGIKDSSSLIGIWELIDVNKDTEEIYPWNGGFTTRSKQLQEYFCTYGLENYNALCEAANIPPMEAPQAISGIGINGNSVGADGYYMIDADSVDNVISFNVLPATATGYTKSYALAEDSKQYAYIENDRLTVRPSTVIPSGTVLHVTVSAGAIQQTLKIKVIRKYNINYILNFPTDYAVDSTFGVLEGSTIAQPSLMKKITDGKTQEIKIERFGYRLTGWANYQDGEYVPYDFSRPVASNLNLFAQWQKITNIVTFDAQGGSFENGQIALTAVIDYNEYAEQPETDPTRAHYIFQGWYEKANGEIPFDFENTNILKKVTVFAKWIPVQYTVTLQLNGGTLEQEKAYTSAEKEFKITVNDPAKLYYDFAYWALTDGAEIDLNNYLFLKDTAIKAVYTPTLYTVKFNTDGGTEIPAQAASIDTGFLLPAPVPAPQKTGYTFIAWQVSKDGNVETVSNVSTLTVKADITLTAVYELNKYTVSFYTNGGNAISPYRNISHGMTITEPTAPQKEDYKFAGWYKDETLEKRFLFEVDAITENTVLYAAWTEENVTYTVTFYTNIPNKAFSPITVAKNAFLGSRYTEDMNSEREGYRFDGWFTAENFENLFNAEVTPITADITLHAKWVALTYVLQFTDGERVLDSKTYSFDEEVNVPQNPEKEGYTFIGWSQEIPARMPGRNLTINANFAINSYTLTYFLDENGEVYREKSFKFGETVTLHPNAPQKTGHTFLGWDKEAPATMPSEDFSITAQWTKIKYKLTLYLTDSTDYYTEEFAEVEVEYDTVLTDKLVKKLTNEKPVVVPYGYKFAGWNFGEFTTMPAFDIDATLNKDPITVNLTLYHGSSKSEFIATCGESLNSYIEKITLDTENYLYDGTWQYENGSTVSEDAVVATKDLVLTANCSQKTSEYVADDLRLTNGIQPHGSMYLISSNFADFDNSVLSKICGSVTLKIKFTASLNVNVKFYEKSTLIHSCTVNYSDAPQPIQVEIPYHALLNGLEISFSSVSLILPNKERYVTDIQIEATAHDNYCVEMVLSGSSDNTPAYQLFTFNSLDEVNTITYTVPTKASTTKTFATSPTTVTGSVYYNFNGWKVNGNAVNISANKLLLRNHFGTARSIILNGSFSESYGNYKADSFTRSFSPNWLETDAKLVGMHETKPENRSVTTTALSTEERETMEKYFDWFEITIWFEYYHTNDCYKKAEGYLNDISRNSGEWGGNDGDSGTISLYMGKHRSCYAHETIKLVIWSKGQDTYNKWSASNIRVEYKFS